ncbi:MAG: hypothetical protein FJ288_18670 [Planctomycetes bacterium]|nr:hypothetical protein [Planctomycetota bacterium]
MDLVLSRQAFLEMIWQWHGDRRGCYRHVCLACGRTFYASRPDARYCRGACRQRAYRRRLRRSGAAPAGG